MDSRREAPATTYSPLLHPAAERLLRDIKAQGFPGYSNLTVEQTRAMIANLRPLAGPPEPVARVEHLAIHGDPDVPVRMYVPDAPRPMPVVVYFHGGGWIAGDCDDIDAPLRALANRSRCAIVSVDYRLAPEHKFPAAFDDACAAVRWAASRGERFGWDGSCLAVAGDSAGGNLAAAVALYAREHGPPIRLQLLIYPVLDHDYDNDSYREFGESWGVVTRADMAWFHSQYVNHPDQLDLPYVSPLRAAGLSGLPEALLILPEADPLRDEALEYARRLRDAGVPATAKVYTGMIHGFWQLGGVLEDGRRAIDDAAAALHSTLAAGVQARSASRY